MNRGNPPEKSAQYRPKEQAQGPSGLTHMRENQKITNPALQTTLGPQFSARVGSSPTDS